MSQKIICFDVDSHVPKYRQIVCSVKSAIEKKVLKKGSKIPSINQLCSEFNLSRDTVLYAYNQLKSQGIIASKRGKGYFVETTDVRLEERIFLLLDEFSFSREEIYNTLYNCLNNEATVDVFFHHNNYQVFKKQIIENEGKFTSYVIFPGPLDNIGHLLTKLPENKVIILGRLKAELNNYKVVYQDLESDMYDALVSVKNLLKKYRRFVFVQGVGKEFPERVGGFRKFCQEQRLENRVVKSLDEIRPLLYDVFLVPNDRILVELIRMAYDYDFEIGRKFGIISFNDNVLKQLVAGGLTTFTFDYAGIGRNLAEMILAGKGGKVKSNSGIIIRKSL